MGKPGQEYESDQTDGWYHAHKGDPDYDELLQAINEHGAFSIGQLSYWVVDWCRIGSHDHEDKTSMEGMRFFLKRA